MKFPTILCLSNALIVNMPWEDEYGYAQAVKSGDTVWMAGQVEDDEKAYLPLVWKPR